MSDTAMLHHASPKRKHTHVCALCGRPTDTGQHVEALGFCGPECITKVAGLHKVLTHYRLHPLARGPKTYEMREGTNAHGDPIFLAPEAVEIARGLARNSPFVLIEDFDFDVNPPTITIRLVARRSPAARRTIRQRLEQAEGLVTA